MTRRQALAVLAATLVLVAALDLLVWSLYRGARRDVAGALDERLAALGRTAARAWPGAPADFLRALVDDNRLEDAYLLDRDLVVIAGARTAPGARVNLLRLDAARVQAALAGTASVAPGYRVDDVQIESGYFPAPGGVLALEAGAPYYAPLARLRWSYGVAGALTLVLAALFSAGLWLGVRALERARVAHGRAERLAAVGQMAAMVAHEVRNPLGVVRGQVELLREKLAPEIAARERGRFEDLLAELERLNRLTQEFLTLARDAPLERGPVDVAALAEETAAAARAAAPGAHIECAAGAEIVASGDAGRLRQALLNLILNAAQAGGDGVHVRVAVARAGDAVRVTVSDDGPGVPAELRATLFEPFVGARPGGSGLGLAIAARIAERHGGRLALADAARGATFVLTLPEHGGDAWAAS